jgi:hypothetical protein
LHSHINRRYLVLSLLALAVSLCLVYAFIGRVFSGRSTGDWLQLSDAIRGGVILFLSMVFVGALALIHYTRRVNNGIHAALIGVLLSCIALPPVIALQWQTGEQPSKRLVTFALAAINVVCSLIAWKIVTRAHSGTR